MYTETYLGEGHSRASSQSPASASSILVADCGTVFTKVSLLGLVEGQYRLMARGEAPTIVVLEADNRRFGLVVDSAVDTQEIVVKPLGKHVRIAVAEDTVIRLAHRGHGSAQAEGAIECLEAGERCAGSRETDAALVVRSPAGVFWIFRPPHVVRLDVQFPVE